MNPPGRKRVGFAVLCWLYVSLHLNRQILAVLGYSVKSDLQLSDAQLGLLTGSAFSIVYALLGLHFGQRADRSDRWRQVAAGAVVWSAGSCAAVFARGFAWLIACRGLVAVGEAIATAAAVSLIAEIPAESHRARGAGLFFASAYLGAGLAAIVGGTTLSLAQKLGLQHGWQAALGVAGAPGLLGAAILTSLGLRDDDRRTNVALTRSIDAVGLGLFAAAAAALLAQILLPGEVAVPIALAAALLAASLWIRRLRREDREAYAATIAFAPFRWLLLAFSALLFIDTAAGFWLLPLAQQRFVPHASEIGTTLGALIIVCGIVGTAGGGWIADQAQRFSPGGRVWTALAGAALEIAAMLGAISQSSYAGFLIAFAAFCFFAGVWTGVAAAIGFDLLAQRYRGVGTAVYFLATTLLGAGLGPFVVGLFSDALGSLASALACTSVLIIVVAIALVRLGSGGARPEPR